MYVDQQTLAIMAATDAPYSLTKCWSIDKVAIAGIYEQRLAAQSQ